MSVHELVGRGITIANYAINCDRAACKYNDPDFYRKAQANYALAVDLYSQAHALENRPPEKEHLRQKIVAYRDRYAIMTNWLADFQVQQDRETLLRKNSLAYPVVRPILPEFEPELDPELDLEFDADIGAISYPNTRPIIYPDPDQQPQPEPELQPAPQPEPEPQPAPQSEPQPEPEPKPPLQPQWQPQPRIPPLPEPEPNPPRQPQPQPQPRVAPLPEPEPDAIHETKSAPQPELPLDPPPAEIPKPMPRRRVRWDDVAGLAMAKEVLQEATVVQDELPELFGAGRRAWRTILLYGPAGAGKRLLASAAAGETGAQMVAIGMEDVMGRGAGDVEAGVRGVFARVRGYGRVVLFFAEVEVLFGGEEVSEGVRRARARFLGELDGLREGAGEVVFVAATRKPWTLEEGFVRRMEKRVFVGLPGLQARAQLLEVLLRDVAHDVTLQEIENIARECEGYSGADLAQLVRDAVMEPVRIVRDAMFFKTVEVEVEGKVCKRMTPCTREAEDAVEMHFSAVPTGELHAPPVSCLDFELALEDTKPSVAKETVRRHVEFTVRAGQSGG